MDNRLIKNLWPLYVKVLHFQYYDLWIWSVNGQTQQKLQWIIQRADNLPVDLSFLLGLYNEVLLFSFLKHLVIVDKLLTVHEALHLHKLQLLLQHLQHHTIQLQSNQFLVKFKLTNTQTQGRNAWLIKVLFTFPQHNE